jgi:serine/alanine adding enzyme
MSTAGNYEVLTYDDPEQREKWRALYGRFQNIDVSYLPEYAYLFELKGEGRACCFVYREADEDVVIYPFLQRRIKDLPLFRHSVDDLTDITSPYGYSGYLASRGGLCLERFFKIFKKYCQDNHIVTEFIRFHPLLNNHEYCRAFIPNQSFSEVVVLDLTKDKEQQWNDLSPTCRNKIRKASKNKIKIFHDEKYEHLDTFCTLYTATMQRLGAQKYYSFTKEWFEKLVDLLADNVALFHALYDDGIIMSALFLYDRDFIHYFLSGSDASLNKLGANNLMLFEVADWAQTRGIRYLNLGGGMQANDSLFKFKASFSPLRQTFCVGNVVHNPSVYRSLCDRKLAAHEGHQPLDTQFFPFYRSTRRESLLSSDTRRSVIILGASGHARVCRDILIAQGNRIRGFFDDNPKIRGTFIHELPVLGDIKSAKEFLMKEEDGVVIAIGDNYERKKIFLKLSKYIKDISINVIHPSAVISHKIIIGSGNFIAPGVIINTDTRIGSYTIINTGATIDHDNCIHDFAQISPGCNLAGDVIVEEGAFLGTGAVVIPGKTIGAYSIVGAGAVVINDIPPYCTAVGVPARVIKQHHGVKGVNDARGKGH